jgi:hypothetical protein
VSQATSGWPVTVSAATLRAAAASGEALAARQRAYAAQDAAIVPESFTAPDLTNPEARAAARRAGVDLDHWLAHR